MGLKPGDSIIKSLDKIRKASPLAFLGKTPMQKTLCLRNGDNWGGGEERVLVTEIIGDSRGEGLNIFSPEYNIFVSYTSQRE